MRLLAAADLARSAFEGSRSDRLLRLFDYLLAKTLAGESPSEQQIALEAYNDGGAFERGQDANVRVYIHRLRKVIDATFANAVGPKLHIPIGEYRIRLIDDDTALDDSDEKSGLDADRPGGQPRSYWRLALLAIAVVAIIALGWMWGRRDMPPLAQTLTWRPLDKSDRPLIVVVGDYYLFARLEKPTPTAHVAPQLIWDKSVPTREDLTILQMLEPSEASTLADYNQQFVTSGTIEALSTLRSAFAQLPALRRNAPRLVAASQLTPEMLKSSDVIYIGQFSGLPVLLRGPLAQGSGFRIDPGFGGLTDKSNLIRYQSDGMVLSDERIARRDYAYLAGFPGPAGNRMLVIAGLGDAGLKEAAKLVIDLSKMKRLGLDPGRLQNGFEVLYRVRTIKNVNVGSTPVLDRPLRSSGIWDNSGNVPAYRPLDNTAASAVKP